jgi:beta-glucosidase
MQWGNYNGTPMRTITILDGIRSALTPDDKLIYEQGCSWVERKETNIREAVAKVATADVVVFAGGISPSLEGEEMGVDLPGFKGGDRTDIELPAVQRELIKALSDAGKKVILVNCSGSPIGFVPETKTCQAILQAWYPGQAGGKAVAEVLFGDYNPAGRLPVTFYRDVSQLPDFEDYNMTGRTYRYMTEEPLFPFGYGLSYTTFQYGKPQLSATEIPADGSLSLTVPVKNTGKRDGDEVVQVYLRKRGDAGGPVKALRAFRRVHISAGQQVEVKLGLTGKQLEWWDEASNTMRVHPGSFDVMIGSSSRTQDLQTLSVEIL